MVDGSNGAGGGGADDAARKRPGEPLGANSEIGRKLKQHFDDVVSEGVPDRFAQLLSRLEHPGPSFPDTARGKE